jgi:tRNA A37 threonylcarbamoyladenosine dehydratase
MLIEQVSYNINWRNFKRGASFFIPCIDTANAKKEIERVTKRLKIQVISKTSIEEGVKGLRVWKI